MSVALYSRKQKQGTQSDDQATPGVGATTMSGSASMSNSHSAQTRATTAQSGVKTSTCNHFHVLSGVWLNIGSNATKRLKVRLGPGVRVTSYVHLSELIAVQGCY